MVLQALGFRAGHCNGVWPGTPPLGKTDALIAAGVNFCLLIPGVKTYLFRRTYKMLEAEVLPRMLSRIPDEVAHYRSQDHSFTFTNGSVFRLGYLATAADLMNYQGVEMQLCLFDELTQFTRAQYVYLRSRLRMAGPVAKAMIARGLIPRMISTSNPAGPGHAWVKIMYIDSSPGRDIVFMGGVEDGDSDAGLRSLCYLPALARDNPALDQESYQRQLAGLDPILRRAYAEGDWDVAEGVRFPQFFRSIHVLEPGQLPIPASAPRAVGVDWGISAPFAAIWGALLPDGLVVIYRELVAPNLTAEQQARLILESEEPGERDVYRPIPVALDPSCWSRAAHQVIKPLDPNQPAVGSVAWFYRQTLGGAVHKATNDRLSGWQLFDHLLAVREDGLPRLLIYSTCRHLIAALPAQQRAVGNPNDIGPHSDDAVDGARYLIQDLIGGRPLRVPPVVGDWQERDDRTPEEVDREYDKLPVTTSNGSVNGSRFNGVRGRSPGDNSSRWNIRRPVGWTDS